MLEDVGWSYGVPLDYVKELAEYWRTKYDWREHEVRLNEFPQFTTTIDGENVHFLHVRSPEPDALPLIITHGWPGSIAEFMQVIGPLTDPASHGGDRGDAFHIVAPSIPGYAFSGPTKKTGWHMRRVAEAFAQLMARLGYDRYVAHGGDWGAGISRDLGLLDPEHVAGVHVTMLVTIPTPEDFPHLTQIEQQRLARGLEFRNEGMGYFQLQSTKPQTLAYGLADSPAGQLAWITEKFKEWTDCQRPPGRRRRPRPVAHQRLDLLVHEHGRLLRPHLLRDHQSPRRLHRRHPGQHDANRGRRFPARDRSVDPPHRRAH